MEIIVNKRTQTPNKYREENDYMVGILENGEEFIFDKDEFGRISQSIRAQHRLLCISYHSFRTG